MQRANAEIRAALKAAKIPVWRVALEMGVHENTVLRKLRIELSENEKSEMLHIIQSIKEKTA